MNRILQNILTVSILLVSGNSAFAACSAHNIHKCAHGVDTTSVTDPLKCPSGICGNLSWKEAADIDFHAQVTEGAGSYIGGDLDPWGGEDKGAPFTDDPNRHVWWKQRSVTFNDGKAKASLDIDNYTGTPNTPEGLNQEVITIRGEPASGTYKFAGHNYNNPASPASAANYTVNIATDGRGFITSHNHSDYYQETGYLAQEGDRTPEYVVEYHNNGFDPHAKGTTLNGLDIATTSNTQIQNNHNTVIQQPLSQRLTSENTGIKIDDDFVIRAGETFAFAPSDFSGVFEETQSIGSCDPTIATCMPQAEEIPQVSTYQPTDGLLQTTLSGIEQIQQTSEYQDEEKIVYLQNAIEQGTVDNRPEAIQTFVEEIALPREPTSLASSASPNLNYLHWEAYQTQQSFDNFEEQLFNTQSDTNLFDAPDDWWQANSVATVKWVTNEGLQTLNLVRLVFDEEYDYDDYSGDNDMLDAFLGASTPQEEKVSNILDTANTIHDLKDIKNSTDDLVQHIDNFNTFIQKIE